MFLESYLYYQLFLTVLKFDTQLNAMLLATLIMFIFGSGVSAYVLIPGFVIITFGGAILAYFGVSSQSEPIYERIRFRI